MPPDRLGRGPRRSRAIGCPPATTPTSRCAPGTCSRRSHPLLGRLVVGIARPRDADQQPRADPARPAGAVHAVHADGRDRDRCGVINIAAIVAIAWLVRRTAGERAVLPAMCAVGLLTWTMGSEMLITPRQHQFDDPARTCACWSPPGRSPRGDRWAIVVAVAAASLVAQTHLSYPVLVAALAAVMVVGQVVTHASRQPAVGGRRPLVVAGALARRAVGADPRSTSSPATATSGMCCSVRAMPVGPVSTAAHGSWPPRWCRRTCSCRPGYREFDAEIGSPRRGSRSCSGAPGRRSRGGTRSDGSIEGLDRRAAGVVGGDRGRAGRRARCGPAAADRVRLCRS